MGDLALAMDMDKRTKGMVQAQIVYRDALGDDKRKPIVMMGGEEGGTVHGGRLGRDHTLADVPNHFVRDNIMDYINQAEVEEDIKMVEGKGKKRPTSGNDDQPSGKRARRSTAK
jgi:hypothetical protein